MRLAEMMAVRDRLESDMRAHAANSIAEVAFGDPLGLAAYHARRAARIARTIRPDLTDDSAGAVESLGAPWDGAR